MLPKEVFLFPTQNIGFEIPPTIFSEEALERHRPPRVVKTFEQRLTELTTSQRQALTELQGLVAAARAKDEQTRQLLAYVDDWTLLRYLVARSFRVSKAMQMLEATGRWRIKHPPEQWRCKICHGGNAGIHMLQFVGWDRLHRPVLYASMRWSKERNDPSISLTHTIEAFYHAIQLMPVGVEQWVFVTDFHTYSHLVDGNPKMSIAILQVLQDHFPERLGLQVMIGAPAVFGILFKLISRFIEPRTREKVLFLYPNGEPSIHHELPKLFPKPLSDYMCRTLMRNCDPKGCQAIRDTALDAPTVAIRPSEGE
jgi:hypothetical protein